MMNSNTIDPTKEKEFISLLSKLTIIIPTYNRQRYALRNMGLWSGTAATVHVLDGSSEAVITEQLSGFGANIHYHHFPISILLRLAKVVDLVDTEYAVLLGDDEIFIPSAVESLIFELENNEELVACCGRGIDKSLVADLTVHWSVIKRNIETYTLGANGAVDQDEPVERMIYHMNPFNPSIIYAVCRSREWIKTMQLICSRQFSATIVLELQFELSMSFYGKVKVIDKLAWLRSGENAPATEGFELSFDSWFLDRSYREEVDDFLTLMAIDLALESKLDFEAIRRGIELACQAFVAFADENPPCNNLVQSPPSTEGCSPFLISQTLKVFIKKCIHWLNPSLKVFIKKSISSLPASLLVILPDHWLCYRPYIDVVKGLESAGLHVDWDELNTIIERLRKFHENKS